MPDLQDTFAIVDTHQHLWDMDLFRYSWCEQFPHLNRSFRMPDYMEAAAGLNIERTVYVDADVDDAYVLAETMHLLQLAEQPDNPLEGVVAGCRPEQSDFPRYLEAVASHPRLKGLRRVLHTQPDELSQRPVFIENLRRLPALGLTFDLCVLARQLPLAIKLVDACPEITFILDHCGVPKVKERELDPWCEHIRQLAGYPNVNCKISGLVAYADPRHWTANDLRPFVEFVLECFGWDRVVFGSDWPVCTVSASLRKWVTTLQEMTAGAGHEAQRKLFYENARRIYRV